MVGGRHLGIDIARQGGDSCVATLTEDGSVCAVKRWGTGGGPVMDFVRSALIIEKLIAPEAERGWEVEQQNVHIEGTGGWGAAVYDILVSKGIMCDRVDVSGGAVGDWTSILGAGVMFKSRRQELIWVLMRLLQEGLYRVPNDPKYAGHWADLQAMQKPAKPKTDSGYFEVESSDDFRARTGRSPDFLASLYVGLSRTGSIVPAFDSF
jgi:hypothetical protein